VTTITSFLTARLTEELDDHPDSLRETQIKASLALIPECAAKVAEREPGWDVYDRTLRQLASRFASHPEYSPEWRLSDATAPEA